MPPASIRNDAVITNLVVVHLRTALLARQLLRRETLTVVDRQWLEQGLNAILEATRDLTHAVRAAQTGDRIIPLAGRDGREPNGPGANGQDRKRPLIPDTD